MPRFVRRDKPVVIEAGPRGPLTVDERKRFAELCGIIDRGMVSWIEVGKALCELSPSMGAVNGGRRLYRETHSTFEEFIRDRWGFGRTQAWRLASNAYRGDRIQARLAPSNPRFALPAGNPNLANLDDKTAHDADETAPAAATAPMVCERHVRAMHGVPVEKEAEVIDRAMSYGGPLTAAKIAQAAKVVMGDGEPERKIDVAAGLEACMKAVLRLQRELLILAAAPGGEQLRPDQDVAGDGTLAPAFAEPLQTLYDLIDEARKCS